MQVLFQTSILGVDSGLPASKKAGVWAADIWHQRIGTSQDRAPEVFSETKLCFLLIFLLRKVKDSRKTSLVS